MKDLDPFEALDLVPHPLIVVTAGDPENPSKRGGMTAAWFSRVSWDPPLVAVSIAPSRYTYELIKEFKAFAIHIISKRYEEVALNIFGSLSGRDIDKFAKGGIKPIKAQKVVAPIIPDVPIILECRFITEFSTGDHIVVVGEVVKAYRGSNELPLVWFNSRSCEVK
jgi:flavin reductase (DIM6/NTAB) family NADH-FMN oxidoreductase RutF